MSDFKALSTYFKFVGARGIPLLGLSGLAMGCPQGEAPTWHADVTPIIQENCLGACHATGGIAPFSLEGFDDVVAYAGSEAVASAIISSSVASGEMPPWPADPDCATYQDQRGLTEAEIDTIRRWEEAGGPLGDPSTAPPLPEEQEDPYTNPQRELRPAIGHLPNPDEQDDYHCFILDPELTEDLYVTRLRVVPEVQAQAHHGLVYLIPPSAAAEARDMDPDGSGYSCFGGPGISAAKMVGGWVPGNLPIETPPESAYRYEAGSVIVLQMHYNLQSAEPSTDRTSLQLWTTDEQPTNLVNFASLLIGDFYIEAGAPSHTAERNFLNPLGRDIEIIGVLPHMHQLGARTSTVASVDGEERCLADIPEWDFNWQQNYRFHSDQYLSLGADDSLRLLCEWDNSPGNQPIVGGQRLEPQDVRWGEGSLDEMCITYLEYLSPYSPSSGAVCTNTSECLATCELGDTSCLVGCGQQEGTECLSCVRQGIRECGAGSCGDELAAIGPCVQECSMTEDISACLQASCPDQLAGIETCMQPLLDSSSCDQNFAACGISL